MRTISIAESSSKVLFDERLDPRKVNSLGILWKEKLGLASPAIQVSQNINGDSIRTDHVVGVLKVGDSIIEIFPKFLASDGHDDWHQPFLNLVRYANGHVSKSSDDVPALIAPNSNFTDVIGMFFNEELKNAFRRGLPRCYKERRGTSTMLEGALDLSNLNSLVVYDGKIRFRSPFLSNQSAIAGLIGWSAGKLASLCSDPNLVSDLVRWNQRFAQTDNFRLPSNWKVIKLPRSFGHLQSLVEIGQLLAGSQLLGVEYGASKVGFPGFIWRTADLYERAIYRLNSESLVATGVRMSKKSFPLLSIKDNSVVRTVPDLVYTENGVSVLVGDAKYKNRRKGPETSDAYQVMAAADVTGCSKSILFYPASGSKIETMKLDVAGFGQAREIVIVDVGLGCFVNKSSLVIAKIALRTVLLNLFDNK